MKEISADSFNHSKILISFEDKPDIGQQKLSEFSSEVLIQLRNEIDTLLERSMETDKKLKSDSSLSSKIQFAKDRASEQTASEELKDPIYLFEDDHSETRPGKPGEDKSYYCCWFEFYSFEQSFHENQIYEVSERVPSYEYINEQKEKIYHEFRKKHPDHPVVVLKMEPLEGMSARVRMDEALKKYRKDFNALKKLSAYKDLTKAEEPQR